MEWTALQMEEVLGHATWMWDQVMGAHVPICSGWKQDTRKGGLFQCGNVLIDSQVPEGLCSAGPHLPLNDQTTMIKQYTEAR